MAQAYPYLDLTVMPQMRDHVVSPRAAILFSSDLAHVLWANGEGAQLLGAVNIRRALEGDYRANTAMIRQIAVAARKLDTASEAQANIRLKSGFSTRLVGISVTGLDLPDGEKAVLVVTEGLHGRSHSRDAMAQTAVDGLDGYSHAAAVLDAEGTVAARSQRFSALDISANERTALVREVAKESDRLVKRRVPTSSGDRPAGIARLSGDPALHLLVIADTEDTAASVEPARPAPEPAEPPAPVEQAQPVEEETPAPFGGQFSNRREKPGRNRLKRWYYKTDEPEEPEEVEFLPYEDEALEPAADAIDDNASPAEPVKEAVQTIEPAEEAIADPQPVAATQTNDSLTERLNRVAMTADSAGEAPAEPVTNPALPADAEPSEAFQFRATAKPTRFVWEMDAANNFVSVSGELADAVGPASANVAGMAWDDVGTSRGLKNASDISALLEKGDTWSGKTVLWPVQGTDLRVPVDLAGLPSFDRNRAFSGFTGFGIIRAADAMIDPEGGGLDFAGSHEAASPEPDDDFGHESGPAAGPDDATKIVDIGTRRSARPERELSSGEQNAFDEIAQKLSEAGLEQSGREAPKPSGEPAPKPAAEPFTPSAFAKRVSDNDTPSTTDRPGSAEVDTSILAKLPIPVLVYRSNDMLFANEDFFGLTGYSDLADLAANGGVNALFGLRDGEGDDEEAVIYHRDGRQLDVRAHLQRVPWDQHRAMLLTLRRNGGGPGDGKPKPAGDEDSVDAPVVDAADSDELPPGEDLRPSIRDASPISLELEPTEKAGDEPPLPLAPIEDETVTPPLAEVWIDQPDRTPSKAFGGLTGDDMRSILDVATDGIVILTHDGTVRAINRSAEALFDIRPEKIEGESIKKLLAPESHRIALDYLSGMSGTGVASLLNDGREIIGQTAKGGLIPLFMTVGKLEESDACCAVMRDITQFKKAEEDLVKAKAQAESANALKSDFLAKISHEIRTPLNAIIGFSDLMIEERFGRIDNDRYRGYLRDIRRSGNHVLDLVNDLLDISKIESGKVDLEFDACDLNSIVAEAVAMTQPAANKERVIIRTSLSAVVPKVVADPRSIRQVVLNIVSNSIKYTKQGGQVIVSTVYDENGEVVLRIRDTGVGMNDLELARAMKPFQQVGSVREAHKEGTGLGLPLTKALVEANRARFHIESEPAEGTMVEIHFPIQRVLADH